MAKSTLYFTFANQEDRHLDLLKTEMDQLKDILRPLEQREFIKIEREESTTTEDLVKTFSAFPDQIMIFHYAGHAGSRQLELEGGSANAKGLAGLLGEQKNLQLVFLNGCSTKGQVAALLQLGVKAVIATSVPIADQKAVDFSSAFYRALANKRSIKRAFEFARESLLVKYKEVPEISIKRGLDLDDESDEEELMPWVLYFQDEAAISWRLPYYREVGLPNDMINYIGKSFKVNRYIVMVLDEMCRYNKDIYHQMIEVVDGEEVKRDSSNYPDLVIKNFPWIIGCQIQLLRQKNQANNERLDQLLSTYIITSMVLYYILLSDFWDEKRRLKFSLPKGFSAHKALSEDELLTTDFLVRVRDIAQQMQAQKASFFVPEIESISQNLASETHLAKAHSYLEQLRKQRSSITQDALEKTCLTAEQAVAVVLKSVAFLADYRMLTVRNISIDNPRYGQQTYELNLGALHAIVNTSLSMYEDDAQRRKETYSNCKSIVLTPSEKDLSQTLNLSPFFIDKNTFLNKEHIDLYFFGFKNQDQYHYLAVKHNIFIALQNEKGTDIIDTTMSQEDFEEGRNINRHKESEDDFGFGEAFGFKEEEVTTQERAKVFALIEDQFEQFQTDFS
ncbi:MAG: hypothetical protein DHS20C18_17200 [Saprospiraceae bacterium]|nr:MAG: hypothetical protein DHS20C18_17200 [Saprospiraceae bacterium]